MNTDAPQDGHDLEAIGHAITALEEYIADNAARQKDELLRPKRFLIRTIVVCSFAAVFLLMIVVGIFIKDADAQAALIISGGIGAFICLIGSLVSLANDFAAAHIQDAAKPEKAYKRFFSAVQSGRSNAAYLA